MKQSEYWFLILFVIVSSRLDDIEYNVGVILACLFTLGNLLIEWYKDERKN